MIVTTIERTVVYVDRERKGGRWYIYKEDGKWRVGIETSMAPNISKI
jgi:hypothetical protein